MEEILTFLHSQHGPGPPSFERMGWGNVPKLTTLVEEPLGLELKPPPSNLEYVFLKPPSSLLVVIAASGGKSKANFFMPWKIAVKLSSFRK